MRQNASACASVVATVASSISLTFKRVAEQGLEQGGRIIARIAPTSPRSARASDACRRGGCACPECASSTRSRHSSGTISKPSIRLVCACRKRSRSSARLRIAEADPGDRARDDRRDQPERRRGDDPERALGADQQLVEAVAAIVLLEARQSVVDRRRREARLRARATSERIVPNCRTCVPPALVATRPPTVQLPRAPSVSGKRMAGFAGALVQVGEDHPRFGHRHAARRSTAAGSSAAATGSAPSRPSGGVAPADHRRISALRDQRDAMFVREPDDRGDFLGRRRREDGLRRRRGSGRASRSARARCRRDR